MKVKSAEAISDHLASPSFSCSISLAGRVFFPTLCELRPCYAAPTSPGLSEQFFSIFQSGKLYTENGSLGKDPVDVPHPQPWEQTSFIQTELTDCMLEKHHLGETSCSHQSSVLPTSPAVTYRDKPPTDCTTTTTTCCVQLTFSFRFLDLG